VFAINSGLVYYNQNHKDFGHPLTVSAADSKGVQGKAALELDKVELKNAGWKLRGDDRNDQEDSETIETQEEEQRNPPKY